MEFGRADSYYIETKFGQRVAPATSATIPFFQGKTEWGYINVPIRVRSYNEFKTRFGGHMSDKYLPDVVRSFFRAGGQQCYVMSMKSSTTGNVPTQSSVEIDDGATKVGNVYFLYPCAAGDDFSVEFKEVENEPDLFYIWLRRNGNLLKDGGVLGPCSKDPTSTLFWENIVNKYNNDGDLINELGSDYIYIMNSTDSANIPDLDTVNDLAGGSDGLESVEADYIGTKSAQTGIYSLLPIRDNVDFMSNAEIHTDTFIEELAKFGAFYNIPCVVDIDRDISPAGAKAKGVIFMAKDYGEDAEVYPIDTEKIDINYFINSFVKVIYPWKKILDPNKTNGDLKSIPGCGFEIGGYCAQDAANAQGDMQLGRNFSVSNSIYGKFDRSGVMGLQYTIDDETGAALLNAHINETRTFYDINDVQSYMAWGERTLSKDYDYKFFSNRRMLTWIQRDLVRKGRGKVFKPQDSGFLASLEGLVKERLSEIFEASKNTGVFFSDVFDDSVYIRCDDPELNTPAVVAKDMAICEVGVRLARMNEFVIFRVGFYITGEAALV
jgi:phage tail sheath protein FI